MLANDKADLLALAAESARSSQVVDGPPYAKVKDLLDGYLRHVAPEDLQGRSPEDVYGAMASHYARAASRPQGTSTVRVLTPNPREHGWSAGGCSVVEVVIDDMPFLVDSVTMELSRLKHNVHVVMHPRFRVTRNIAGQLQDVETLEDGVVEESLSDAIHESWMHVEIDRVVDEAEVTEIVDALQTVLRDVRESVEDWKKMSDRALAVVAEIQADPPPLDASEIQQGCDFITWLAGDHFTFLGYREYRLEAIGDPADEWALRAVPGSGLGILRADQNLSSSFAKLPPLVQEKAREKTLLVLAKANSRATVHRPAYLDYVGVKTFDQNGEVVGERRFLGLYSSAAYAESVTRIPLLRDKTSDIVRKVGFDPRSHAGKALLDTMENYPRDELFHTSVDELAPTLEAVMFARERRQPRLFARRDTYGRYVSVLVYLPRDRYNTELRVKIGVELMAALDGRSLEFTPMLTDSPLARIHYQFEQFRYAIFYYDRISRDSEQWLDAMFESSWAHFRLGEYEKSLGNLVTLQSPFFAGEYYPESSILKAITFYENCRYPEARAFLGEFTQNYGGVLDELNVLVGKPVAAAKAESAEGGEKAADANAKSAEELYEALTTLEKKVAEGKDDAASSIALTARLLRLALSDKRIAGFRASIAEVDEEKARLTTLRGAFNGGATATELAAALDARRAELVIGAGTLLRDKLEAERGFLTELKGKLVRIQFEIGKMEKETLEATMSNQQQTVNLNDYNFTTATDDERLFWPFEGEYWRDELGTYQYTLTKGCRPPSETTITGE